MKGYINYKNYKNTMDTKILLTFLLGLFLISFSSAVGDIGLVKGGDCIDLYNYCPTCSFINLTAIQYPNGSITNMNYGMVKTNNNYEYSFCNTTLLGEYGYTTCGDKGGIVTCENIKFESTFTGKEAYVGIDIILLLFFSSLLTGLFYLNKKVDYKKWYENILRKYENKNYIKMALSTVGYNVIINTFGLYYCIGFLIMLTVTNLILAYDIIAFTEIAKTAMWVYSFGVVLIAFMLFGQLQEFIVKMIDDMKDINWGINQ